MADGPLTSLRPVGRAAVEPAPPPGPSDRRPDARPTLRERAELAGLAGVSSILVAPLAGPGAIESLGAGRAVAPASTMKALTALWALDALGPGHRFATRLLASGPIEDGRVRGDLILSGGGDPTFDTEHLAGFADALRDAGVTAIDGQLRVWRDAIPFVPEIAPEQMDHLGYNPSVSGMMLNFNRVYFVWDRQGAGYVTTMDARTGDIVAQVETARMEIADRALPVYTWRADGDTDVWSVARPRLGRAGGRWLPVRNPGLYAGDALQVLAADRGVTLPEPVLANGPDGGREIARRESEPLQDILRDMLRFSTNVTAEAMGLSASVARGLPVSDLAGSAGAMGDWLNGRHGTAMDLRDHSGLSEFSRVTAADMVRVLQGPGVQETLMPILRAHVLRDGEGNALDHPAAVRAKTGTLNFVSALAGYVEPAVGAPLAFAILSGDMDARAIGIASGDERPAGAAGFNARAKRMQQDLLQRWGLMTGPARP
ncbi:MAG: D-alanyl-D-alanine carboxypeptidase/D-alanyl-D-alanine endopeptidase [Paracoccaceae bacterium]